MIGTWSDRFVATQDCARRRVADGKTRREAIRCLQRYIVHEISGNSTGP